MTEYGGAAVQPWLSLPALASCLIWPALAESESARQMNRRCHAKPLTYLFRLWEWPECIGELVKVDLGQGDHIAIYYFTGEFIKIAQESILPI
jgi:hypothetical protein